MTYILFDNLQVVTFVHLILITNALAGNYLPPAYTFYNLLFMVALFWTQHSKESVDAIHMVYSRICVDK